MMTSRSYSAHMTVVTFATLMDQQRESLRLERTTPTAITRLARYVRSISLAPARRAFLVSLLFVARHALVLGGCAAIVISAATVSATLGWVAAGVALFFLEARRR